MVTRADEREGAQLAVISGAPLKQGSDANDAGMVNDSIGPMRSPCPVRNQAVVN